MLTEREQQIHDVLVAELERSSGSNLIEAWSYAEKKHVVEALDPAFIRDALKRLQRRAAWSWRLLWISLVFLVGLLVLDIGVFSNSGVGISWLTVGVAFLIQSGVQYGFLQRRLMAYKVFAVLSGADQPAALAAQPAG